MFKKAIKLAVSNSIQSNTLDPITTSSLGEDLIAHKPLTRFCELQESKSQILDNLFSKKYIIHTSKMKVTAIIASALVLPTCSAFVVPSAPRADSFLAVSYLDELELSSPAAEAVRPRVHFPNEDAETIALANQLGIDDNVVRNEYGRWLARYNKNFDINRYAQFKKNWLQQFSHDVKYGKFYTLNEFGDCTEGMSYTNE